MAMYDRCTECREIMGSSLEISIGMSSGRRIRLHPECLRPYGNRQKNPEYREFYLNLAAEHEGARK